MESKFKFSIVMAVYNSEKYLNETIDSIIQQDLGFEDNVQLIIIDDGSSDNSKKIALNYKNDYPNNIIVLSKENGGQASARNMGLKYIEGEYVNFLDSDDKFSKSTLKNVYTYFDNHNVNIIAIPMFFFDRQKGEHKLNKKFTKEKVVNVYNEYNYPQLSMPSCFIKQELLNNLKFDERAKISEDAILINKLLIEEKKIAFINNAKYFYRKRNELTSTIDKVTYSKDYYLYKTKYFFIELIDYCLKNLDYVPEFIQYVIAYDLQWYYYESDIFSVLTKEEYNQFMENMKYILKHVQQDIILNHEYLTKDKKSFLIYLKNDEFHIDVRPHLNKVFLKSNEYFINRLHNHTLHIDSVEYCDKILTISGLFSSNCKNESITIEAVVKDQNENKKKYVAQYIKDSKTYRHDNKPLGITWKFYYNFNLEIPIDKENLKIDLKINFNENNESTFFLPKINLRKYCLLSKKNYFIENNKIILFKDNALHIINHTKKFEIKLKINSIFK